MKLPNGAFAILDLRKINEYCLSPEHPRGRHRARVFHLVLGLTAEDTLVLASALQNAAAKQEAIQGASDQYGNRFIIDFEIDLKGRTAQIRSCWIVLTGETVPRFVTCYIL
ncbi:MAG: DUF6883 domain-containing protein [Terracidiphilus sp.]